MNIFDLNKKLFAALLLAFMASAMLPACSSTDEAAQDEGTGGAGDCSQYTNEVDIRECEMRQNLP